MISVITPVYDGERFIESCIQNVIDQHCSDAEHIIMDGGSKDRTVEIIQRYAAQYPHIRWISEKDQGQSDAMNKGINIAKGSILAILNVDDYYEPNVLNRVIEVFSDLPEPSLVVGNCNVWNDKNELRFLNKPKKIKFTDLLLGHDANPFPVNPSAYFYHTSLHQRIGFYSLDEHYTMDIDFLLRAVQVASLRYVNETWGNYRQIEGTKTLSDIQSGEHTQRFSNLIKKYQATLPLPQRWIIPFGYGFYKAVDWPRFRYFLDEPKNLLPFIEKKLNKLVKLKG